MRMKNGVDIDRVDLTLDLINNRVNLSDTQRKQVREVLLEQFTLATKEERKKCEAHADSVARTSALLPVNDPDRDGPKCARRIERLIHERP